MGNSAVWIAAQWSTRCGACNARIVAGSHFYWDPSGRAPHRCTPCGGGEPRPRPEWPKIKQAIDQAIDRQNGQLRLFDY